MEGKDQEEVAEWGVTSTPTLPSVMGTGVVIVCTATGALQIMTMGAVHLHHDNIQDLEVGDPPLGFLKNLEDSCDRLSCSSCSCFCANLLLCKGPFEYVKGSKNPCWHSAAGRLSCVPYFYLAGVSKSGTSDIFQRISHHPDVIVSHKEHHWFDRHRYYSRNLDDNSSFEWYLERFRNVTQAIQRDLLTSSFSKKITGDGSPSYFYDSLQWQRYPGNENCTEPRMLLPHHIRHLYHEARIILSFRHPVSRLYSRFLYDHRKDNSSETFHSWVVDGLAKYLQCFRRWSLRHCAYNRSLAQTVQLRINENLYPVLMEDWLRVFPRQQLLLIRFEDYCRNMSHVLSRIFTFLDLAPLNDTEMTKIASTEKIKNKGTGYKSAGLMLAKTAHILQEFYQPFIRRFARLVGDDSYLWTDVTISHQ
ncbi:hypothetical protein C0Q70_07973 [Pomacea canaliculata]|uniref:Sulfotransferase domain-containing protein n=1 Tax=Pomacea canaliculata TaxID=400727 RepID=A0A2T7PGJ0_POMCA|nr:hypothetical protein C0Q70_07973 [Pomacea canaliculata]